MSNRLPSKKKRTNFIVICKPHSPSCPCCAGCEKLKLSYVKYGEQEGYHYKASKSISQFAAERILEEKGVTQFLLEPCQPKSRKSDFELLSKRPAPVYQDCDLEEQINKFQKTNLAEMLNLKAEVEEMKKVQSQIAQKQVYQGEQNEELYQRQSYFEANLTKLFEISISHEGSIKQLTQNVEQASASSASSIQQLTQNIDKIANSQDSAFQQLNKNIIQNNQNIENFFRQLCLTATSQKPSPQVDRKQQGHARVLDPTCSIPAPTSAEQSRLRTQNVNSERPSGSFFVGHNEGSFR